MNSRVVGIIKFEASGVSGLTLESWLASLMGDESPARRWDTRSALVPPCRRIRADIAQLAEDLDREYLELTAS